MKTFIQYEMQLQSTNTASSAALDIVRVIGNPIGTFAPSANQPMSVYLYVCVSVCHIVNYLVTAQLGQK